MFGNLRTSRNAEGTYSMPKLTCKSCVFWVPQSAAKTGVLNPGKAVGACHTAPPVIQGIQTQAGPQFIPLRPNTEADDAACSQYRPAVIQ